MLCYSRRKEARDKAIRYEVNEMKSSRINIEEEGFYEIQSSL